MLASSPDGLSDAALARALGGAEAGFRPQTVNQICRRLAAEGHLERVGSRPIVNRLPPPPPTRARRRSPKPDTTSVAAVPDDAPVDQVAPASPKRRTKRSRPRDASETEGSTASDAGTPTRRARRPTSRRKKDEAETAETPADVPDAAESPADVPDTAEPATDVPDTAESPADVPDTAEPVADAAMDPTGAALACEPPPFDALQAWSRVANVHALVAGWLVRRGATLRSAGADESGPARDLVASLDGDDVHVEVTRWPPDGARTHPTTIAGDWFAAAEQAAAARRRAHPRARIVIALPDTRRYRSLTERSASSLQVAGAEVWFVDPAGSVHAR